MSDEQSKRGPEGGNEPVASSSLLPEERSALDDLPRELSPPPGLEDRLVHDLRREGLVASGTAAADRLLLAAAALVCVALGLGAGRLLWGPTGAGAVAEPATYLLALYGEAGRGDEEAEHERLVEEYSEWARRRAEAGELLAGEPLSPEGWLLSSPQAEPIRTPLPSPDRPQLVGYFMIQAEDSERALAIAGDCPHLLHGGSVLVRPIGR